MPIAASPPPPNSTGTLIPLLATASAAIPAYSAVAIVSSGGANPNIQLCGAFTADAAMQFCGFAVAAIPLGGTGVIVTGRGSLVTPIVEGSVPLVPGNPVYLSETPGQVTQTPVFTGATLAFRVGHAVSTTSMSLLTDFFTRNP